MSRVGKQPIEIPSGAEVIINDNEVKIKGPKGTLERKIRPEIRIEIKENKIFVFPKTKTKKTRAFWGLTRALLANMVKGVTEGFEKKLEIEGLGYRAQLKGNDLELFVGFTQPVIVKAPEGISFKVEKNIITVSGIDKERVGQVAANIRKVRPPEPYKGKGIRYLGEQIRRKAGKKAVTAATE